MKHKNSRIAAGLFLLVVSVGLSGCASTTDIDALRKEIHEANMTARSASVDASRAREEALAASQLAGQAKSTAEAAKAQAEATDAKIDRMFKKTMYK